MRRLYEPRMGRPAFFALSAVVFCVLAALIGGWLFYSIITAGRARGADLELLKQKHGKVQLRPVDGELCCFGEYSLEYYQRRWRRMCAGPQRYDAMREANDRGQPQPCQ